MKVEFFRHDIGPAENSAIGEALQSVILTTGDANREFERRLASYLGVDHAVTTSSCTAALQTALVGLGIRPGDEVITTPLSFVATANAVLLVGARPVFVDVHPLSGLIDPAAVEAAITPATRAVIPVHLYGEMADMRALRQIADRYHLALVEDAAHALEAERDGFRPGQLGDAAAFSFYATKSITCGEGGALVTRDPQLAERVRRLRNHGLSTPAATRHAGPFEHWDMLELGWKCNLTNFQAAMLIPQLQRVEENVRRREAICLRYEERFDAVGLGYPRRVSASGRSARHLSTFWAPPETRDSALACLTQAGIGTGVHYRPIHLTEYYRTCRDGRPGQFPHAERIGAATISLPLYARLADKEVERVLEVVETLPCTRQAA